MDFGIYAGDTSKTIYVFLQDSTTGLAKTGIAYNSAGAIASYNLPLAARSAITLATQTVTGAWSSGGFVEVDATNEPGIYRFDVPNAAIASGSYTVITLAFTGVKTCAVLIPLHVRSVNVTQWLGTAAATPTVAGVPEVDVTHWIGTAVATPTTAGVPEVDVTYINGSAASGSGTPDVNVVTIAAGAITAAAIATDAIDADALATDAIAEIADAVWDEDATAHQTQGTFGQAIGDPVADTNSIFKATVTDATLATVGLDVVNVSGRIPAALTNGNMDSYVAQIGANAVNASALATDAVTEIWAASTAPTAAAVADAVWDEDATAHQTQGTFGQAIGDPVADTNSLFKAVVTDATGATVGVDVVALKAETADILADTATLGTPTGASVSADIAAIKAETVIIKRRAGFLLAQEVGACSDPQTAAESYTITIDTNTYTVDHTSLDSNGTRGIAVLTES